MALLQHIKLPRRITINDSAAGITVTQSGSGESLSLTPTLARTQLAGASREALTEYGKSISCWAWTADGSTSTVTGGFVGQRLGHWCRAAVTTATGTARFRTQKSSGASAAWISNTRTHLRFTLLQKPTDNADLRVRICAENVNNDNDQWGIDFDGTDWRYFIADAGAVTDTSNFTPATGDVFDLFINTNGTTSFYRNGTLAVSLTEAGAANPLGFLVYGETLSAISTDFAVSDVWAEEFN